MANYYYVTIESEKMTQDVANEILQTITPKQLIRSFKFHEGYLFYNTRGLVDITKILEAYGFNDAEDKIEIKDEFECAYNDMTTPEESVSKDIKNIIDSITRLEEHGIKLSVTMTNIKKQLDDIIREG